MGTSDDDFCASGKSSPGRGKFVFFLNTVSVCYIALHCVTFL